ncbi:uncharacterized protein DDB_G0271670 [Aplysia californica]|uniref:Uncharacterized protein DDB_G0271670 n=1 Tax=Aplysia californica TaxID=6500 RepID=A0ABM0K1K4_APLCA|nr:uncharacterized protein DDB_G0271670 [Aplysia californica]
MLSSCKKKNFGRYLKKANNNSLDLPADRMEERPELRSEGKLKHYLIPKKKPESALMCPISRSTLSPEHRNSSSSSGSTNQMSSPSSGSSKHTSSSWSESSNHHTSSSSSRSSNHHTSSSWFRSSNHSVSSPTRSLNYHTSSSSSSSSDKSSTWSGSSGTHLNSPSRHSGCLSSWRPDKHVSRTSPHSYKSHESSSSSMYQSSSSGTETYVVRKIVRRSNIESQQSKANHDRHVVPTIHHARPLVRTHTGSTSPTQRNTHAHQQTAKKRTPNAIHKENSKKREGGLREGRHSGKQRDVADKHGEKAKSPVSVHDIVSSEEDETEYTLIHALLYDMKSERKAQLKREKIARKAKEAWERAVKKDYSNTEKKPSRKRTSPHKRSICSSQIFKSSSEKSCSSDTNIRENSMSPLSDWETTPALSMPKKHIVRHSRNGACTPMNYGAVLTMAKQNLEKKIKPKITTLTKMKIIEEPETVSPEEMEREEIEKADVFSDCLKVGGELLSQSALVGDRAVSPPASKTRPIPSSGSIRNLLKPLPCSEPVCCKDSYSGKTAPQICRKLVF